MTCQLPADCLNEIFEYLEEDNITLHSCLLVNRLWCKVSVRILWRDIWSIMYTVSWYYKSNVSSKVLSTLIACLPNESKDLLHENRIFISTPTSKPPLFNYASFCKVLSIREMDLMIENQQFVYSTRSRTYLIGQEIIKMFMNQISSLKKLMNINNGTFLNSMNFTHFPGARDCLTELSELSCNSDVKSEFFYQLSQICHSIQSLTINFGFGVSSGLRDLISSQNNLKHLTSVGYSYGTGTDWEDIVPSLRKHSTTLIKLKIDGLGDNVALSFISIFINLQELVLSSAYCESFEDFKKLQDATFTHLQILKFPHEHPKVEVLIKFLENNGRNLKEFYIDYDYSNNSLNTAIAKFCPKLNSTCFMNESVQKYI